MVISADKIRIDKHFIGESVSHMRDVVKPLKQQFGITSFSYIKLWPNSIETYLTTCPEFCQAYYDDRLYESAVIDDPAKYKAGYLLGNSINHSSILLASQKFNINHQFFIIRPCYETCEIFVFATTSPNPTINNHYINNLDLLNAFADQFKEQASLLLTRADKNRVYFPTKCEDTLITPYITRAKSANIFLNGNHLAFTVREKVLIKHIINGLTAKEMAREIEISSRTVEKHIANLKRKFQCKNSIQLAAKLSLLSQKFQP